MGYIASGSNNATVRDPVDVSIDIGSSYGRKAIIFGAYENGQNTGVAIFDPGGGDEIVTTNIIHTDIQLPGWAWYTLDVFYVDIPDTLSGTYTFRYSASVDVGNTSQIAVWIGDKYKVGSPEASGSTSWEDDGGSTDIISGSITTVSPNATIVSCNVSVEETGHSGFTTVPNKGVIERIDVHPAVNPIALALGDLNKTVAGVQSISWRGSTTYDVGIQALVSLDGLTVGVSSIDLELFNDAGTLKLTGGTLTSPINLTVTGSSDLTLVTTSSNNTVSFPSSSTDLTLLGTDTTQSFSNKSGSFIEFQIPSISGSPQFTPTQGLTNATMVYDTASVPKQLYIYDSNQWRSSSFT